MTPDLPSSLLGLLPTVRDEALAASLSPQEIDSLDLLARAGTPANSLRALVGDLQYLHAWSAAAAGPLVWPAPETSLLRFIAHHSAVGGESRMPEDVSHRLMEEGRLKALPPAYSTLARRWSSWRRLHRIQGLEGAFDRPAVREALALARRAGDRRRRPKSGKPILGDVLLALLESCKGDLPGLRDRALLLCAWASGGRRRSEVARLTLEQLERQDPQPREPGDPPGPPLPCYLWYLATKTRSLEENSALVLLGPPAEALEAWLAAAGITEGPVFRAIDRFGRVGKRALNPASVNLLVKQRAQKAGLDPALYSAHGLRSGFMTEGGLRGLGLAELMAHSQHASLGQAQRYHQEGSLPRSRAARLSLRLGGRPED